MVFHTIINKEALFVKRKLEESRVAFHHFYYQKTFDKIKMEVIISSNEHIFH